MLAAHFQKGGAHGGGGLGLYAPMHSSHPPQAFLVCSWWQLFGMSHLHHDSHLQPSQ